MESTTSTQPVLVRIGDVWVVRVDRGNGKIQEYRCTNESQAKALAAVFTMH